MESTARIEYSPFRWSAVFAGAFMAVAVWLVLHLIGLGIGVITVNMTDPRALRSLGLGTSVLAMVAPLIALFVGGVVAARVAGPITRVVAALHGAVLWSMATILSGLGVAAILASMAGGLDRVTSMPMNKEAVAKGLANSAPVDSAQAHDLANRIEKGIDDVQRAANVMDTADDAGGVFLFAGIGLVLGLISAMLGASIGVSRRQVRAAQIPIAVSPGAMTT